LILLWPARLTARSIATIVGMIMNFTPIDPIRALYWSAVINGVVAVPVMVAVMVMVSNGGGTANFALPPWLRFCGWLASGLMALAVALFALSSLLP
jgi:Mn2+/Fe2+ NRAMP family transporter